jgi:hypothetical protein
VARRTIARGQLTYYWLHIDAEVGERDLAAFCGASSAQLLLVVIVLAILAVHHGPDKHQEPPGDERNQLAEPTCPPCRARKAETTRWTRPHAKSGCDVR